LCALCERLTDSGLAATIFVVPWLLGGVRPAAQLLLAGLALATTCAWLISRCCTAGARWHWLGVEPLLVVGVALVWLQFTPLADQYLTRVSPHLRDVTALHGQTPGLDRWSTISVTPAATREGLANLASYCLLFIVMAQRVRQVGDARRYLGWTACSASAMAVFGLIQFLSGTDRFFWVIDIPHVPASEVVHGSFVNRNHLAQFLALGAGPLLMFALGTGAPQPERRYAGRPGHTRAGETPQLVRGAAWAGFTLVCLATVLSLSRGGVLALATSVLVVLGVGYRGRLPGGRMLPGVLLLGGAFVLAMFLPWADALEHRVLESVATLDIDRIDQQAGRRRIWETVAKAIAVFPIAGTGVGSHRAVYPMYFDHPDERIQYSTAESGFLQLTLETGGAGLLLVCIGLAWIVSRCLSGAALSDSPEKATCLAAALAGIAANAVHSAIETPWFMPGCMVQLIPLVACAAALSTPQDKAGSIRGFSLPRFTWATALVSLGCAVSPLIQTGLQASQESNAWHALTQLEPSEGEPSELPTAERKHSLDALTPQAVSHPRLQLRLAKEYLQVFDELQKDAVNPMSVGELRQAALAAEFRSADEIKDWLDRATGGNSECLWTARKLLTSSLNGSPLEGEAFAVAAELCFLEGEGREVQQRYLTQAALVRPYDPRVMFAAGQLEWQSDNLEQALVHWKQAYQRSRKWEDKITSLLINVLPAETFLTVFEPDWTALRDLRNRMVEPRHPEYEVVARRFAEAAVVRSRTVEEDGHKLLLDAHQVYLDLADEPAALECALAATALQRHSYPARIAAARLLLHAERFNEAVPHLQWCLRRKPADEQVAGMLRFAMERQAGSAEPQHSLVPPAGDESPDLAELDQHVLHADFAVETSLDEGGSADAEALHPTDLSESLLRKESGR
jgi:hypothetical protein